MAKKPKTSQAIWLGRAPNKVSLSQIGGWPLMPSSIEWPRNKKTKRPLHFLVQIDLASLPARLMRKRPASEALPDTGLLLFFADMEQELIWGEDIYGGRYATTRVIYVPEAAAVERLPPDDLPPLFYDTKTLKATKGHGKTYPVQHLEAHLFEVYGYDPDRDEFDVDAEQEMERLQQELSLANAKAIELSCGRPLPVIKEENWATPLAYVERKGAERHGSVLGHQLIGPGVLCQAAAEEAYEEGRIPLLQLRDDYGKGTALNLSAGLVQFWIKPAELAKRKFDKAFATFEA
jgi:uncharacterized protein YwqG